MSAPTIVGDFVDSTSTPTGVDLELRAIELVIQWRRTGLTADWLARFFIDGISASLS